VIDEVGNLSEWVWSGGERDKLFVYKSGRWEKDRVGVPSRSRRIGVLADDGWGTSFTPRSNGEYHLTLEVLEGSMSAKGFLVQLFVQGGGRVLS